MRRRADILVINPNSNAGVTAAIDAALAPLRFENGPAVRTMTLADGPFGVESQKDADSVVMPLRRIVEADVRDILRNAEPSGGLGTEIAALFAGIGLKEGERMEECAASTSKIRSKKIILDTNVVSAFMETSPAEPVLRWLDNRTEAHHRDLPAFVISAIGRGTTRPQRSL